VTAIVLVCLATYRVTRLICQDSFPPLRGLRERVLRRWGELSWQFYLSTCMWCVSVYVGGLVTWLSWLLLRDGLAAPLLVWPVASAVTGLIAVIEPEAA
jgi:hypothetical protein